MRKTPRTRDELQGFDRKLDCIFGKPLEIINRVIPLFWLANLLTISRAVIMPFYLIALHKALWSWSLHSLRSAFLLLWWMAFTDLVDGYVARKLRSEGDFGGGLDPLCDKLVIFGSFIWFGAWFWDNLDLTGTKLVVVCRVGILLGFYCIALRRFYQDAVSTIGYKRKGGKSNNFGKKKFHWDLIAVVIGLAGAAVMIKFGHGYDLIAPVVSLALVKSSSYAQRSLELKRQAA